MCDREAFARLKDAIVDLQKADAVQSEQIKTLFQTTKQQGETQQALTHRLVMAVIGVLVLAVLALIVGAIGKEGFNAITSSAAPLKTLSLRQGRPCDRYTRSSREGDCIYKRGWYSGVEVFQQERSTKC